MQSSKKSDTLINEVFEEIKRTTPLRHDPTSETFIVGNAYYELSELGENLLPESGLYIDASSGDVYFPSQNDDQVRVIHFKPKVPTNSYWDPLKFEILLGFGWKESDLVTLSTKGKKGATLAYAAVLDNGDKYSTNFQIDAAEYFLNLGESESDYFEKAHRVLEMHIEQIKTSWNSVSANFASKHSEEGLQIAIQSASNQLEKRFDTTAANFLETHTNEQYVIYHSALEELRKGFNKEAAYCVSDEKYSLVHEIASEIIAMSLEKEWNLEAGRALVRLDPRWSQFVANKAKEQLQIGFDPEIAELMIRLEPRLKQEALKAADKQLNENGWNERTVNFKDQHSDIITSETDPQITMAVVRLEMGWDAGAANYLMRHAPDKKEIALDAAERELNLGWNVSAANFLILTDASKKEFAVNAARAKWMDDEYKTMTLDTYSAEFNLFHGTNVNESLKILKYLLMFTVCDKPQEDDSYNRHCHPPGDIIGGHFFGLQYDEEHRREKISAVVYLRNIKDSTTALKVAELYQQSLWFKDDDVEQFIQEKRLALYGK